eukprot:6488263-Amphidinium_carterae.1
MSNICSAVHVDSIEPHTMGMVGADTLHQLDVLGQQEQDWQPHHGMSNGQSQVKWQLQPSSLLITTEPSKLLTLHLHADKLWSWVCSGPRNCARLA